MPRWRAWLAVEVRQLRAWRAAGVPRAECAARLGRTVASVRQRCHAAGVRTRHYGPPSAAELDRLRELAADGCGRATCARELGVCESTIHGWAEAIGVRFRRGFAPDPVKRARVLDALAAGLDRLAAVARVTGLHPRVVSGVAKELRAAGLVAKTGRGPGTRFAVAVPWTQSDDDDDRARDAAPRGEVRAAVRATLAAAGGWATTGDVVRRSGCVRESVNKALRALEAAGEVVSRLTGGVGPAGGRGAAVREWRLAAAGAREDAA